MELGLKNETTKPTILSFFETAEQVDLIVPLAPIFEKYTRNFDQLIKSKFTNLNYFESKKYINFRNETFGYRSQLN